MLHNKAIHRVFALRQRGFFSYLVGAERFDSRRCGAISTLIPREFS
jgi:hypothetical protein